MGKKRSTESAACALARELLRGPLKNLPPGTPVDLDALTRELPFSRRGRPGLKTVLLTWGVLAEREDGTLEIDENAWTTCTCPLCGKSLYRWDPDFGGRVLHDGAGHTAFLCRPCAGQVARFPQNTPVREIAVFLLSRRGNRKAGPILDRFRSLLPALPWEEIEQESASLREAYLSEQRRAREEAQRRLVDEYEELQQKLSEYGAELDDIVKIGEGYYAFKLYTPLGSYLDEGTAEDILRVAKRDARILRTATCPFCKSRVELDEQDVLGNGSCPSCMAVFGSIARNFGESLADQIFQKHGMDGLYEALQLWDLLYQEKPRGFHWFNLPALSGKSSCPFHGVVGPQFPDVTLPEVTRELEVMCTEDDAEDPDPDWVWTATCSLCRYCLRIEDWSACILGLGASGVDAVHICMYPTPAPYESEPEITLEAERMRGYVDLEDNIVKNAVVRRLLEELPVVDDDKRLYGIAPGGYRVEPICPRFTLDPEKVEYGDVIIGTVPVTFNRPDWAQLRWEEEQARFETMHEQAIEKLREFAATHPLAKVRIQAGDHRVRDLIEALSAAIPRELLKTVTSDDWKFVLHVSNKVAGMLQEHFGLRFPEPRRNKLDLSALRKVPRTPDQEAGR